jgi:1-acyl-sn-glycerol-3-phosphate acyltransferase
VSPLEALTRINLDDLVNAFGWQDSPWLARLVRMLFARPARAFAWHMLEFDAAIASRGLADAACLTERRYVRHVQVFGSECLPEGPSLILANHPGMTDTLALFAALAQPGLRVIALDRPFLLSLPNLSHYLDFVNEQPQERVALVRRVLRHLRSGGSILTFPAGHTEPDPQTYRGATESLASWSDSTSVFVRLAPETAVVPVCIRGVTWGVAVSHPLVRLRSTLDDRMLLASALQLLANVTLHLRPVTVTIQVGAPIRARDLGTTDGAVIHRAVLHSMRKMIENPTGGRAALIL